MPVRSTIRTPKAGTGMRSKLAGRRGDTAGETEVRIFVSYSHADDAARLKLEKHLAPLKREDVLTWFDGDMNAGDELDPEISKALRRSHLFVALISASYLSSEYCWKKEYLRAMGRRARGSMRVIGIVLKPCDWKGTSAARFKQLPKDGRAVSDWRSADHAFADVTTGIRTVVKAIRKELVTPAPKVAKRTLAIPTARGKTAPAPHGLASVSKPARTSRSLVPAKPRTPRNGVKASVALQARKPPKGKPKT